MQTDDIDDLRSRLNLETGTISWSDLVRHFARGVVLRVESGIDLVEVAADVAADDVAQVQTRLELGVLTRASDDDARDWTSREPDFWCVVIAPWVLVQERCE